MSMKQTITIDGQEVAFKASAAIPRIYRMKFHRDIFKDLRDLEKSIDKNEEICYYFMADMPKRSAPMRV